MDPLAGKTDAEKAEWYAEQSRLKRDELDAHHKLSKVDHDHHGMFVGNRKQRRAQAAAARKIRGGK